MAQFILFLFVSVFYLLLFLFDSELPDYHYWPMIQNELNHKSKDETVTTFAYRQDATNVPRFFKSGIPKTPVQEQDWYIPLKENGRFDWKENIRRNGYTASLFSKSGWNRRYHVAINRPFIPVFLAGLRQFAHMPIHFRQFELPLQKRLTRHIHGSSFDRHAIFVLLYCGFLASAAGSTQNCMCFVVFCILLFLFVCFVLLVLFCLCILIFNF